MSASINTPVALALGGLVPPQGPPTVTIGKGGAITIDNTVGASSGAVAITGTLAVTTITATGDITWPHYSIEARIPSGVNQTLTSSAITSIAFTTKFSGTGIAFSNPQTVFTIPVSGMYAISYHTTFAGTSVVGTRALAVRVIDPVGPVTTTYGFTQIAADAGSSFLGISGAFTRFLAAGATVEVQATQISGGNLAINVVNSQPVPTYILIDRLHD